MYHSGTILVHVAHVLLERHLPFAMLSKWLGTCLSVVGLSQVKQWALPVAMEEAWGGEIGGRTQEICTISKSALEKTVIILPFCCCCGCKRMEITGK